MPVNSLLPGLPAHVRCREPTRERRERYLTTDPRSDTGTHTAARGSGGQRVVAFNVRVPPPVEVPKLTSSLVLMCDCVNRERSTDVLAY